jgi:hypothetical protein
MALTDRERQQIRDLARTTPLTFRWEQGTRLPAVNAKELVFFENEALKSMRVGVRRGRQTYWLFTGTVEDDDDQDAVGSIDLLRHAKRHVTATYENPEDPQTAVDPITPYKFTWTGEHIFSPAEVDRVPITVNALTGHTSDLVVIVDKYGDPSTNINAESQHSLFGAAQTAVLNVKAASTFTPASLPSLEAWYDASLETGGNGSEITSMVDRSGNGHTLTAFGSTKPTVLTSYLGGLNMCWARSSNNSYFRQAVTFQLTDSFTVVWIGLINHAANVPALIGGSRTYNANVNSLCTWRRNTANASPPDPWNTSIPKWSMTGGGGVNIGATVSGHWLTSNPVTTTGNGLFYVHSAVVTKTGNEWKMTKHRFNGIDKEAGTPLGIIPGSQFFTVDYTMCDSLISGEMIVCNEALSEAELANVENYLSAKWSFTSDGVQDTNLEPGAVSGGKDIFSGEDNEGDRRVHIDADGRVGLDGAVTVGLNPAVRLHVRDTTTPQVIVDYDASNQLLITVAVDGATTFDATGDISLLPGSDILILGDADAGTKTVRYQHTTANGTMTYDGDVFTWDKIMVGVAPDTFPSEQLVTVNYVFEFYQVSGTDFVAGDGLTGGGVQDNVTPTITFNAGAGKGIAVNADDIELDISTLDASLDDIASVDLFAVYNNSGAATQTYTWSNLEALIDHGSIAGLGDDDHSQYHTDGRGDLRYLKLDCTNDPLTAPLEILSTGLQLRLRYDGTEYSDIYTDNVGNTLFNNTGSKQWHFTPGVYTIGASLPGIVIGSGGLTINRSSGPFILWAINNVNKVQMRLDATHFLLADATGANNQVMFRYGSVKVAGEAILEVRDQVNSSDLAFRSRKGNATTGAKIHLALSYNNSTNYTQLVKTRHNSGAETGNHIDFYLWDNSLGVTDLPTDVVMRHFSVGHDNAIIGPSDTDTKTLTFANSSGDGEVTYNAAGLLRIETLDNNVEIGPSGPGPGPYNGLRVTEGGLVLNRTAASMPYLYFMQSNVVKAIIRPNVGTGELDIHLGSEVNTAFRIGGAYFVLGAINNAEKYMSFANSDGQADFYYTNFNGFKMGNRVANTCKIGLQLSKGMSTTDHVPVQQLWGWRSGTDSWTHRHVLRTRHRGGADVDNRLYLGLWGNTISGGVSTYVPTYDECGFILAHEGIYIGKEAESTFNLTFQNAGTDGVITYDGSYFAFAPQITAESVANVVVVQTATTKSVATTGEDVINVDDDAAGDACTTTLPDAATHTDRTFRVKKMGTTGAVTVASAGGNIDGAATAVLSAQYESITVISDGTNWGIY